MWGISPPNARGMGSFKNCYLVGATKIWWEIFPGGWAISKFSTSMRGLPTTPDMENPACCNLVLQLRESILKTNNLLEEKGCLMPVEMM